MPASGEVDTETRKALSEAGEAAMEKTDTQKLKAIESSCKTRVSKVGKISAGIFIRCPAFLFESYVCGLAKNNLLPDIS